MSSNRSRLSRRSFIGSAATALAAPMVIPRSVLGDDKNPAANDKINVGLIGIGMMMNGSHLPHLVRMKEVKVTAVCDVDTTRRENGKNRVDGAYGNKDCSATIEYQKILARKDIDAIVCATPDHWHSIIVLEACKAGKDIYCEKPLTNNLMEAKAVMDAINASKIIFQTGSQQRSSGNFRYACELVRNGRIGDIKQVLVSVGPPPVPCNLPEEKLEPGLEWERWLGPAPMRPYSSILSPRGICKTYPSWRNFCEYGGGGMTDWGAHHFDIAQWGLGMDKSGPVEIVLPKIAKPKRGVKFIYDNGVEVVHGGSFGVEFIGSKGKINVNRGKLESTPGDVIKKPIAKDEIHLYKSPSNSHKGHRQDWVNCIRSRKQPCCPVEVGARTIAVCHLGNVAYLHAEELAGKPLKWDPAKWEFVDNDAANKWQDYPYPRRKGYELPKV